MGPNRKPNHSRTITLNGFECDDGSIELELSLTDVKHFAYEDRERGILRPGDPIHDIRARLRVDPDMSVKEIEADMAAVPFRYCRGGADNLFELVGKRLDRGWRQSVRDAMGATQGCTHLSELLLLAPTLAFQTAAIPRANEGRRSRDVDAERTQRPFFLDACHSWASDSPVTRTFFPQYSTDDDT